MQYCTACNHRSNILFPFKLSNYRSGAFHKRRYDTKLKGHNVIWFKFTTAINCNYCGERLLLRRPITVCEWIIATFPASIKNRSFHKIYYGTWDSLFYQNIRLNWLIIFSQCLTSGISAELINIFFFFFFLSKRTYAIRYAICINCIIYVRYALIVHYVFVENFSSK